MQDKGDSELSSEVHLKSSDPYKGQHFTSSYQKNDHLQKHFNQEIIQRFTTLISEHYHKLKRPLSILDFCCGYGDPTFQIYKQLQQKNVPIESIVGYDISTDMINRASSKKIVSPKITFIVKDLDNDFDDVEQYDVVIALFGLHWMQNLKRAASNISKALRKDGLILSLSPLEKMDLYAFRKEFLLSSRWKDCFSEPFKNLKTFHADKRIYFECFQPYFVCTCQNKIQTKFDYSKLDFIKFLQSWMPEVRHLTRDQIYDPIKDAIAKTYLSELIQSIPYDLAGNVRRSHEGSVIFTEHLYHYQGRKKEE